MSIAVPLYGFGSGVDRLQLYVVGGTSKPTNPKKNTIWVNLAEKFVRCDIRRPVAETNWEGIAGGLAIEYSAWSNVSTAGAIDIEKGNNLLYVKPTGAKYCVTPGTWKTLEAWVWNGSTWTQFSAEFAATINVTFPSGSTVTCKHSDGTSVTATSSTSTTAKFVVPKTGTYTVTITDGTKTKSTTVSITADGQSKSATISYDLVLFDKGKYNSISRFNASATAPSGYTLKRVAPTLTAGSTISLTEEDNCDGSAFTNTTVNLTNYSTLKLNITRINIGKNSDGVSVKIYFGVTKSAADNYTYAAKISMQNGQAIGTVSVDVSSLTGNYYINFLLTGWGATKQITFDKLWLT